MFERATTIDEALVDISAWASSLPGDFAIDASDRDDAVTEVTIDGVLISSGLRLSATLQLYERQDPVMVRGYRFDVRTEASLVWRHDCHPGHEDEPNMTGPQHEHVMDGHVERRIPAGLQTLETIQNMTRRDQPAPRLPKPDTPPRAAHWTRTG